MTDAEERAYEQGRLDALRFQLADLLRALGPHGDAERWRNERLAVVSMLRTVCEEFGDNEWPDDAHLGDVIEKHLLDHLMADDEPQP